MASILTIHDCMVRMLQALASVNTVMYGSVGEEPYVMKASTKPDQLSATDWLDQGLKTLKESGFTALKAEPLAKAMGVSRGSFYWHFADVGAFHAALLKRWREIMTEQIIANLEQSAEDEARINTLLRRAFGDRLTLEVAVRTWATLDPTARAAVQAIDRRRLSYIENLLTASGFLPEIARARSDSLLGVSRLHGVRQAVAKAATSRNCRRTDQDRECPSVTIKPVRTWF